MPDNFDSVPTIADAIAAYKKSGGDAKSPYFPAYQNAITSITRQYGQDAATQAQMLARDVAGNNGDINASLSRYAKDRLASTQPIHPFVKDFLVVADQNPRLLDKFTYGFNLPDVAGNDVLTRVKKIINR